MKIKEIVNAHNDMTKQNYKDNLIRNEVISDKA